MNKYLLLLILLSVTYSCAGNRPAVVSYDSDSTTLITTDSVVVPARFPGGDSLLREFVLDNLKWPSPEFSGPGYVVFKVAFDEVGNAKIIDTVRSLCSRCDSEARRIIGLMPPWEPAKNEAGKSIPTTQLVGIEFALIYD